MRRWRWIAGGPWRPAPGCAAISQCWGGNNKCGLQLSLPVVYSYRAAERAADRAGEISGDLIDRIAEIRATSVQGPIAKARCVEILGQGEVSITASLVDDLLTMKAAA